MKLRLSHWALILCAAVMIGCSDNGSRNYTDGNHSGDNNNEPLTEAQAQEQLIDLFNKISSDMDQIKGLERQMDGASTDGLTATEIQVDIQTLQAELDARRAEIETLKEQLSKSGRENTRLLTMIQNLEAQIKANEETITDLTNQLSEANVMIESLSGTVDELNQTVENVTNELGQAKEENEAMQQQNTELDEQVNRCYYVIGSSSELKKHNVTQGGFLKKTKVKGDYVDNSYFTAADRRTLTSIPTHSKKAKVLSSQPADSYNITEDGAGNKVVNILNPTRFWGTMNYLVIEVD